MLPSRPYFTFMPSWAVSVFYLSVVAALIFFFAKMFFEVRRYGFKISKLKNINVKIKNLLETEKLLLTDIYGGVAHTFVAIGLFILFLGTICVFIEYDILLKFFNTRFLTGVVYLSYEVVMDVAGLIFFLGVLAAIVRRAFVKPSRLINRKEDAVILFILLYGGLSGFIMEGIRLAIKPVPWGSASFVGYILSQMFVLTGLTYNLGCGIYPFLWLSHGLTLSVAVVAFAFTKLKHFPLYFLGVQNPLEKWVTPFNLPLVLESKKIEVPLGVNKPSTLSWDQKINAEACVNCGRCEEACPAYRAGKILSPRNIVQKISFTLKKSLNKELISSIINEDEIWSCTTDGACVKACPALINPLDYIVGLRRYQAMNLGKVPGSALFNILVRDNPYGLPRSERIGWRKNLDIKVLKEGEETDVLYWVGCAASYDARLQKVAQTVVKILRKAGVDFAVLKDEGCCGELARRLGDEYLFQEIMFRNIEKLKKYKFRILLTTCPHGYNIFKNDYSEFNGKFKVYSHIEFINKLLEEGKLEIKANLSKKVTYHDPCYLKLYNNLTQEPRKILMKAAGLKFVETKKFYCCGGGGGGNWFESKGEQRPNILRFRDTLEVNPDLIAVACPYCLSMFEDAAKTEGYEEKVEVKDIAEIISELLE